MPKEPKLDYSKCSQCRKDRQKVQISKDLHIFECIFVDLEMWIVSTERSGLAGETMRSMREI